ncbi:MAG: hypothetical protein JWN14_2664, partial [Chthonomonadales bacterium]|nr:hypothetical protein [Chthonomonadales bacterium]
MSEPHESYRETERRLALRQEMVEQQSRQHLLYGRARIATVLGAALLSWFIFHDALLSAWWLCVPLLVFLVLLARHDRVLRRLAR